MELDIISIELDLDQEKDLHCSNNLHLYMPLSDIFAHCGEFCLINR